MLAVGRTIGGRPIVGVWAREMDEAQNRKLLQYFKDRQVWLLETDIESPKLAPYPAAPHP